MSVNKERWLWAHDTLASGIHPETDRARLESIQSEAWATLTDVERHDVEEIVCIPREIATADTERMALYSRDGY